MASSFEFPGHLYEIIRSDIRDLDAETDFMVSFLPERGHVLDLGCGTGAALRALAARGHTGVGVDRSGPFIIYATDAGGDGIRYVQTSIQDFETEERFDLIYSIFLTLNYLPRIDLLPLFRKIRRWLRPDGRLVLECGQLLSYVDSYQPYVINHHEREGVLITRLIRHRVNASDANWRQEEVMLVRAQDGHVSMYKNFFDQLVLTAPELRHLLADAGLTVLEELGGLNKGVPARHGQLVVVAGEDGR